MVPGVTFDQDVFGPEFLATSPPIVNRLTLAGGPGPIPVPFPSGIAVPIPQFETKEQVHRDYRPGSQLSQLRKRVVEEILHPPTLDTPVQRFQFLVNRARTLRHVSDAMSLEFKYPKPEGQGKVYPDFKGRQEKVEKTSSVKPATFCGDKEKGSSETGWKVDKEGRGGMDIGGIGMEEPSEEFQRRLKSIFDDICPIPELSRKSGDYWQYRAQKSLEPRKKAATSRFWKRNRYPPQTDEERVKALREKASGQMGLEILEMDLLPGIWIPEYMIPEFEITGINYDSRQEEQKIQGLDWYKLYEVKEKCWDWLNSHEQWL